MHFPEPGLRLGHVPSPPAAKPEPFTAAALFFLFLAATGPIVYKFAGIQSYNQRLLALTAISGVNGLGFVACLVIAVKRELSPELTTERMLKFAEKMNPENRKDVEKLLGFLRRGVYINAQNEQGKTISHLVTRGATDRNGPASVAADELYPILYQQGANFNIQDNDGNTPLHEVRGKRWYAAELLIKLGADPSIQNDIYKTAIFYTLAAGDHEDPIPFAVMLKTIRQMYPAQSQQFVDQKMGPNKDQPSIRDYVTAHRNYNADLLEKDRPDLDPQRYAGPPYEIPARLIPKAKRPLPAGFNK